MVVEVVESIILHYVLVYTQHLLTSKLLYMLHYFFVLKIPL